MARSFRYAATMEDVVDSTVVASIEVRIHYTYTPGEPEQGPTYDCGGVPASPPEVEMGRVEMETRPGYWEPADDAVNLWADSYFERHREDFIRDAAEQIADERCRAMEYRAEERRELRRMGG